MTFEILLYESYDIVFLKLVKSYFLKMDVYMTKVISVSSRC